MARRNYHEEKEFFEKMTRDEALCKKLGACKTP